MTHTPPQGSDHSSRTRSIIPIPRAPVSRDWAYPPCPRRVQHPILGEGLVLAARWVDAFDGDDSVEYEVRFYRAFCEEPPPRGLGYDPDTLQRIIDERLTTQERAQQPATLFDQGRPTLDKQQEASKGVVNTFTGDRGSTNADYLTARIARDRPDILDRMKAGEFPSVRAAAMERLFGGQRGRSTPPLHRLCTAF